VLTGNIEPGRHGRTRRGVTGGPLVAEPGGHHRARDLPVVGERPRGAHGTVAGRAQQGRQA